jgi:hypothetical protein
MPREEGNPVLNKLTGTHLTIIILAGFGLVAYGWATKNVDASTLGAVLGAFGAWRVQDKGPKDPPPPALVGRGETGGPYPMPSVKLEGVQ